MLRPHACWWRAIVLAVLFPIKKKRFSRGRATPTHAVFLLHRRGRRVPLLARHSPCFFSLSLFFLTPACLHCPSLSLAVPFSFLCLHLPFLSWKACTPRIRLQLETLTFRIHRCPPVRRPSARLPDARLGRPTAGAVIFGKATQDDFDQDFADLDAIKAVPLSTAHGRLAAHTPVPTDCVVRSRARPLTPVLAYHACARAGSAVASAPGGIQCRHWNGPRCGNRAGRR